MFKRIEFKKLNMVCLLDNDLKLFEAFLRASKKLYELNFEENTISELMINKGIKNVILLNDRFKSNGNLCKYISNVHVDRHFYNIEVTNNQVITERCDSIECKSTKILNNLELREYDFYSQSIGLLRPVYDKQLSTYKRLGKFKYFDSRIPDNIKVHEGVTAENIKFVSVTAIIFGDTNSFRSISVYEDGQIREQEYHSKSSLSRRRIIYGDGNCVISYNDINTGQDYGFKTIYFTDGNVIKGETYNDAWHGYYEDTHANGYKEVGQRFHGKAFGEWKKVLKGETVEIIKYDD